MKKVLLIAVAAFVASFAKAQAPGQGKLVKAPSAPIVTIGAMKSMANREIKPVQSVLMNGPVKSRLAKPYKLSAKEQASLKPVYRLNSNTTRRAGELQSKYNGKGSNYQTKEAASWVMQTAVNEGTTYLINVIPLPEDWASLEYIAVPATVSGNTITIAPTKVAQGEGAFYYIHSWASNDGSIVLTLGEDGSLSTIDGEDIAYSLFKEDRFDLSNNGPYGGLVLDIEKVKYYLEGQVVLPIAAYEPQGLFLNVCPNVNGDYYTNLLMPAYGDIQLKNWTDIQCDSYSWVLQPSVYDAESKAMKADGDPIVSSDFNFTFNSGNRTFEPATLVASNTDGSSEAFKWNKDSWYAGGSYADWASEGTPTLTFSKANPAGDLTVINPTGVKSIIFYQGKPASALYFTGISFFIYQFAQTEGKELTLTCKIHKAHRDSETGRFSLGDLIAQADVESVEEGTWMAGSLARLHWDSFFVEDEMGLSTDVPYLLIDEEFAVVFEGWDNGTFTGRPLVFTSVIPQGGFSSTYAILPDQDTYQGAGWSGTFDAVVGFTNATYGFLHTEDATDITLPATGGEAKIRVQPMYANNEADETGSKTRLFFDNALEEVEVPEWLTISIPRESYTSDDYSFDLAFAAEALPAGVEGRTATVTFMQEGARLTVTVNQGETSGISVTKTDVKSANGQMYNLAGQRVNNGFKGLVIKNGRKFMNK